MNFFLDDVLLDEQHTNHWQFDPVRATTTVTTHFHNNKFQYTDTSYWVEQWLNCQNSDIFTNRKQCTVRERKSREKAFYVLLNSHFDRCKTIITNALVIIFTNTYWFTWNVKVVEIIEIDLQNRFFWSVFIIVLLC